VLSLVADGAVVWARGV